MNKLGNKGRTLVVFGAMVVGTVSLFGSAAFACGGSTASNGSPTTGISSFKTADFGSTPRPGQDPHLDTACVVLTNLSLGAAPTATFQLVAPTAAGAPETLTANGNGAFDVSGMIAASGLAPAAQGYHFRVDAAGKTKVFWVAAGAAGCPGPVSF